MTSRSRASSAPEPKAHELLAAYLKRSRAKFPCDVDFAREVGCSGGRLSQLLGGHGRPSPDLAAAIEQNSAAAVPAWRWFAVAPARKAAR